MATQSPTLLIIDDDKTFLASLERALRRDFSVITASDEASAFSAFGHGPDIVLLDIRLDESDNQNRGGVALLKRFLEAQPGVPVVMTSAYGDIETAVGCMRLGAADFIQKADFFQKGVGLGELRQRLRSALEHARLSRKVEQLEERLERLEPAELVGASPQLQQIKELIHVVARDGYVTVLIRGETGTGKELVAHAIHHLGWRAKGPFVSVAVAALNPNLIESELFGHEAGAFTGARGRRIGYIERAKGGVLFFDEIGDLPSDAQLKLLRFLEERKFSRVGSTHEISIDLQIVCATNRDLEAAVAEGQIRGDLYFRLKSLQIVIPPLRERLGDIPVLASYFLNFFRKQGRTRITEISREAAEAMRRYQWPGNVRELKAVLERANIYANYHSHLRIEKEDLPFELLSAVKTEMRQVPRRDLREGLELNVELARVELSYIEEALRLTEERKTEAWKLLGLNDRFALLRRAKNLLRTYPALGSEFLTVQKLYGKEAD
jgi:two-component system, NtrC family, response regulator AtoC